jgi:hypothetical protein
MTQLPLTGAMLGIEEALRDLAGRAGSIEWVSG